ncbi:MAG TPA: VOC family protein [Acidimicrobiales bacterium]
MLAYTDGVGALAWLADVFGFEERMRMMVGDQLSQAAMDTEFGQIMLASGPPDYEGPRRHAERCEVARAWSSVPWIVDGVLVYVKDLTAHYQHSKARGANILTDPEADFPGLRYRVEDLEGHRWMFMERRG